MEIRATPLKERRRDGNAKTPISDVMGIVYVLLVYQPGSRTDIRWRRESRRPWTAIRRGRSIGDRRRRLRVVGIRRTTAACHGVVEHTLHAYTRRMGGLPANVVALPAARSSATADFLR